MASTTSCAEEAFPWRYTQPLMLTRLPTLAHTLMFGGGGGGGGT
jgi:hypothetical protein